MKKFVSVLVALILAMTVCVSALAAPNGFVESPSKPGGPTIEEGDNVILTPFGDRDELPDDIRQALEEAYNTILNAGNLGDICEALEEIAKQIGVPVKNLVVSELFELTYESGEQGVDGKFVVTLKDDSFDDFFALMKYEDGKWIVVEDAKANDNKLSFTAGKLPAPFAVVVNPDDANNGGSQDDIVPPTGDNTNAVGAVIICIGSIVVLGGVYFVFKKREA